MGQTVKPGALRKGDTIAIVAPSGPVCGEALERGIRLLESFGLKVKVGPSVKKRWGYLAGSDAERAEDLMEAWADPEVRGVIAARGGYGAMRVIPHLDFDCIRQNPKIFLGYSDITTLHLAFWKEAGLVTFHGPVAEMSPVKMNSYNCTWLRETLFGSWPPGDLPVPVAPNDAPCTPHRFTVFEKGRVRGELVGGNLSLIASAIGTLWEIDTRGKVLLLEEVGERPYRIDRMLCHLKLAGKLDDAAGFCLGDFTDCEGNLGPDRPGFTVAEVLNQYFAGTGKPCIGNIPAGHGKYNSVLPLGVEVAIEAGLGADELSRVYFPEKAMS